MYLKSYKELIVWQKSVQLVKEIFILTDKFPKSEIYGIVSQMRRSEQLLEEVLKMLNSMVSKMRLKTSR